MQRGCCRARKQRLLVLGRVLVSISVDGFGGKSDVLPVDPDVNKTHAALLLLIIGNSTAGTCWRYVWFPTGRIGTFKPSNIPFCSSPRRTALGLQTLKMSFFRTFGASGGSAVNAAPQRRIARMAMTAWTDLGKQNATISSRLTPCRVKFDASWRER